MSTDAGHREALPRWAARLLTVTAALGGLCLLVAVLCVTFGWRPLVFTSDSMAPRIPEGSVALAKDTDARDLRVGDVVSVVTPSSGRISHRVVAIAPAPKGRTTRLLTLKGDANRSPDAELYGVDSVPRVVVSIPFVGHLLLFANRPLGLGLLGVASVGLLWLVVRGPRASRAGSRRAATRGAATILGGSLLVSAAVPAVASFSDVGRVASGTMATHAVVSHAQPTCTNVDGFLTLGNIARVSWVQVDRRYDYTWQLNRSDTGATVAQGSIGAGTTVGSVIQLDISTGLIGVNTNYDVVVRARLAGATTWTASSATVTPVRRASVLILGTAFRCGHS